MKIRQWSAIALLGLLVACQDGSDPLVLTSGGNYTYEAYSPVGLKVLQGTIHLEWPSMDEERIDQPIVGTWSIDWVPGADHSVQVGPQVGSGFLEGRVNEDGLVLNLNPEQRDDNVWLHAEVHGNTIIGAWAWSTIAGPTTNGRFTAVPGR